MFGARNSLGKFVMWAELLSRRTFLWHFLHSSGNIPINGSGRARLITENRRRPEPAAGPSAIRTAAQDGGMHIDWHKIRQEFMSIPDRAKRPLCVFCNLGYPKLEWEMPEVGIVSDQFRLIATRAGRLLLKDNTARSILSLAEFNDAFSRKDALSRWCEAITESFPKWVHERDIGVVNTMTGYSNIVPTLIVNRIVKRSIECCDYLAALPRADKRSCRIHGENADGIISAQNPPHRRGCGPSAGRTRGR